MGKKEGGAFWKRRKVEKQTKLKELLQKTPKLHSFFQENPLQGQEEPNTSKLVNSSFTNDTNVPDKGGTDTESINTKVNETDEPSILNLELPEFGGSVEPSCGAETEYVKKNFIPSCSTDEHEFFQKQPPSPTPTSSYLSDIQEQEQTCNLFNVDDPAEWDRQNKIYQDQIISTFHIQNIDTLNFSNSKRDYGSQKRYCRQSVFLKKMKNGETIRRNWVVYSESTGNIFCMYCKLFSSSASLLATSGFSDWAKVSAKCNQHERSLHHVESVQTFLKRKSTKVSKIDNDLQNQIKSEKNYWHNILQRILSVIRFLASRGLPFRGADEKIGSTENGNYLGLLELLSEHDPMLKQHIQKYGSKGSGSVSYLSKTICNEFVEILADTVVKEIIKQIQRSKYFSISVDSTPDITHTDQLTLIIRYCSDNGVPLERFITFLENTGHKSEDIQTAILETITKLGLSLNDCRGQSYDNASNMSGAYNGLQARIKSRNTLAIYVPCAAHSLNLVVKNAAECCLEASSFFMSIEDIYVFFSSSTHRWQILNKTLENVSRKNNYTLKRVNITRWSSRYESVKTFKYGYREIQVSLETIFEDNFEKPEVRVKAKSYLETLSTLEFGFLVTVWSDVLERANSVSQSLQAVNIDLAICSNLYISLKEFYLTLRDKFDYYEKEAQMLSQEPNYKLNQRQRKRKLQYGESDNEVIQAPRDKMRTQVFYRIIDQIVCDLEKRGQAYENALKPFLFLFSLKSLEDEDILNAAKDLALVYKPDLDQQYFGQECVQFKKFIISLEKEFPVSNAKNLMQLLHSNNIVSTFSNVEIILRIFLTLMVTNASDERSFSTLKRVKTYLRNSLSQERLNALSVLNINSDLLKSLDFNEIIDKFADCKSRKIIFK